MAGARSRVPLAVALLLVCSASLAAGGAAGLSAARQRIAIEERLVSGDSSGTFALIPLTAGSIKADSGTFKGSIEARPTVVVDGQRVTTYSGTETLTGKRGTLRIRSVTRTTDAGGEYVVGDGSWSLTTGGTKAYATLRASGASSGVVTPRKVIFTRHEGYVGAP